MAVLDDKKAVFIKPTFEDLQRTAALSREADLSAYSEESLVSGGIFQSLRIVEIETTYSIANKAGRSKGRKELIISNR